MPHTPWAALRRADARIVNNRSLQRGTRDFDTTFGLDETHFRSCPLLRIVPMGYRRGDPLLIV